jgi:uncharacterized metal-binding protein
MNERAGDAATKIGIISCSGEEIPEGTISRLATLQVLRTLRPGATVTICLPLFLAGERGERNFAKTHPTITVDGCDKQCARFGTEKYSGPVTRSLVVSDMLGGDCAGCQRSTRSPGPRDENAVRIVAGQIAAAVDEVLQEQSATPRRGGDDE